MVCQSLKSWCVKASFKSWCVKASSLGVTKLHVSRGVCPNLKSTPLQLQIYLSLPKRESVLSLLQSAFRRSKTDSGFCYLLHKPAFYGDKYIPAAAIFELWQRPPAILQACHTLNGSLEAVCVQTEPRFRHTSALYSPLARRSSFRTEHPVRP